MRSDSLIALLVVLLVVILALACAEQNQETPQAVEREIGQTGYALRGSLVTIDTFATFRHLQPDSYYWFTVKCFDEWGQYSEPSDTVWIYVDPNGEAHPLKGNPYRRESDEDA